MTAEGYPSDKPTFHRNRPLEVDEAAQRPEQVVGKFVLVRKLGEGGFGEVWKAWQVDLSRFVALKFIHSAEPEDLERFTREARLAAQLHHPNITPVYEVGEADGKRYLAMQLIDGVSLDKAALSPREALLSIRDAARAVSVAHLAGIIHRDLKPQNIMRASDGRIFVMDFGLAKSLRAASSLSVSGMVLGTPSYMPPEQAEGKLNRMGPRSDVYALGATLYHILTGRPPFTGLSPVEVLGRVLNQDPRTPRSLNAEIHADIEAIVLKCLEKDPARRYATAEELVGDIDRYLEGRPIQARRPSVAYRARRWCGRHKVVTALTGALLASALALPIYLLTRRSSIEIKGLPPGSRLWLDDSDAPRSTLSPGVHLLRIEHADYESYEYRFQLKRGEVLSLEPKLRRRTGTISFTCSVDGARLTLRGPDGSEHLFSAPTTDASLPTGRYTGEITRDGYFPEPVALDVIWNRPHPLYIFLQSRGIFSARLEGTPLAPPLVIDLDADGVPDIVAVMDRSDARPRFSVTAVSGANGRVLWEHVFDGQVIQQPRILDLNQDGHPDLLLVTFSPESLLVLEGRTGDLLWRRDGISMITARPLVVDVDGDGFPDLVVRQDSTRGVPNSADSVLALSYRRQGIIWTARIPRETAVTPPDVPPFPDSTFAEIRRLSSGLYVVPLGKGAICGIRPGETKPAWTFDLQCPALTTPAIDRENRIIVTERNGNIVGLDSAGTLLWRKKLGAGIWVAPILIERGGDEIVAVMSIDGEIALLDPASGEERRRLRIEGAGKFALSSADLEADGTNQLLVPAGPTIVAVDIATGRTRVFPFDAAPLTPAVADIDGDGIPDLVTLSATGVHVHRTRPRAGFWESPEMSSVLLDPRRPDRLVCMTRKGEVSFLDRSQGNILEKFGSIPGRADTRILLSPDQVAVQEDDGSIRMMDVRSGRPIWTFDAAGMERPKLAVAEAKPPATLHELSDPRGWHIEATGPDRGGRVVRCYYPGSITPLRTADLNGDGVLDVVGTNYFGTVFALDGRTGELLWKIQTAGPIAAAPVLVDLNGDGTPDVVVASSDEIVYAVNGRTGALLWSRKLRGTVIDEPVTGTLEAKGPPAVVLKVGTYWLTVLRGSDGQPEWEIPGLPANEGRPLVLPATESDGSGNLVFESATGFLRCVSYRRRETLWTSHVGGQVGTPVRMDAEHFIVPCGDGRQGRLALLNASDGRIASLQRIAGAVDRSILTDHEAGRWFAYVITGSGLTRVPIELREPTKTIWNPHLESRSERLTSRELERSSRLRSLVRRLRESPDATTGQELLGIVSDAEIPASVRALWRGLAHAAVGKSAEAIADLEEAVRLGTGDADVGVELGALLLRAGRRDEARAALGRQWQRHPDVTAARLEAGGRRMPREVHESLAGLLEELARAEVAPSDSGGFFARGCARMLRQDDAGAHADLTEAIRLLPWCASAYARRGVVAARLGRVVEAGRDLETAKRLGARLDPLRGAYLKNLKFSSTGASEWWELDSKLRLDEVEVRQLLARAQTRAQAGDRSGAAADLDRAAIERPEWNKEIERLRRQILPEK